jgi:hypothetical protein
MTSADSKIPELLDDVPITVLRHREHDTYTIAVGFPPEQEWVNYHVVGHFDRREDALKAIEDKK